ncbi:MAG: glycosyltransferase family 2 protein [Candidatus Melainabacteria bacterium]|nr:MAG: glycosyltransferase family 2 protein [Candidatus Melainabacteria bacterium]
MNSTLTRSNAVEVRRKSTAVAFSAVITLYNEEGNIEPLTRSLIASFRTHMKDIPFELVLVINGSEDRTAEIALELEKEFKELTLVMVKKNRGYGGGTLAGLMNASGDVVGFLDGDQQVAAEDVARVFKACIESDYDIVKILRVVRGDGPLRAFQSRCFNTLFRLMFGGKSLDVNSKPKVLKRAALERMNLRSTDWFLDAEVMIEAVRLNLSVMEIPVTWLEREHGNSNIRLSSAVEFFKNMIRYKYGG